MNGKGPFCRNSLAMECRGSAVGKSPLQKFHQASVKVHGNYLGAREGATPGHDSFLCPPPLSIVGTCSTGIRWPLVTSSHSLTMVESIESLTGSGSVWQEPSWGTATWP